MHNKTPNILVVSISLLFINLICITNSYAEFYRYFLASTPTSGTLLHEAGRANYFDILYDDQSQNFKFYVVFQPENNVLPEGFYLTLNDGPNPKGHDGELAFLYFDASDPSNLKLTVYGYNGLNNMKSWQDGSNAAGNQEPDKILSSAAPSGSSQNPAGWIKDLQYFNDGSKAIFLLNIDASLINSHVPKYPGGPGMIWKGLQFNDLFGIWFHPVAGLTTTYGADGFLTSWQRLLNSWYDLNNQPTSHDGPVCVSQVTDPLVNLNVGQSFNNILTVSGFGAQLNQDTFTVNYANLPVGSSFTVPEGSSVTLPPGDSLNTQFSFVAAAEHIGQTFNINAVFTNQDGQSVSCPFALSVSQAPAPACVPDVCGICGGDGTSCLDCASQVLGTASIDRCGVCNGNGSTCLGCTSADIAPTQATLDVTSVAQRNLLYKLLRNLKRKNKDSQTENFTRKIKKQAELLHLETWRAVFSIPNSFNSCTNSTFCANSPITPLTSKITSNSRKLLTLSKSVLKKLRSAGVSKAKIKRKQKQAAILHSTNLEELVLLPANYSVCS